MSQAKPVNAEDSVGRIRTLVKQCGYSTLLDITDNISKPTQTKGQQQNEITRLKAVLKKRTNTVLCFRFNAYTAALFERDHSNEPSPTLWVCSRNTPVGMYVMVDIEPPALKRFLNGKCNRCAKCQQTGNQMFPCKYCGYTVCVVCAESMVKHSGVNCPHCDIVIARTCPDTQPPQKQQQLPIPIDACIVFSPGRVLPTDIPLPTEHRTTIALDSNISRCTLENASREIRSLTKAASMIYNARLQHAGYRKYRVFVHYIIDASFIPSSRSSLCGTRKIFGTAQELPVTYPQHDATWWVADLLLTENDPATMFGLMCVAEKESGFVVEHFIVHITSPRRLFITNGRVCCMCKTQLADRICAGCRVARYCSAECQDADDHKHEN